VARGPRWSGRHRHVPEDLARLPRCGGQGTIEELFSAWLAVPPEVTDGAILAPSELLRGMIRPVRFRMRVRAAR